MLKIWPKKLIESGATVSSNLSGRKWKKSLFEGSMIRLTNIELTPEFMAKLVRLCSTLSQGSYVLPEGCQPFPHECSNASFWAAFFLRE